MDYYKQSKVKLTKWLSILLTISLFSLTIYFVVFHGLWKFQYIIGGLLSSIILFIVFKYNNYYLPSILFIIGGVTVVSFSIFLDLTAVHYIDPLWIICISLYAFIMLGKHWGLVSFGYGIILIGTFLVFRFKKHLEISDYLDSRSEWAMAVEVAVCMIIIAFFVNYFIRMVNYSELKHRDVNAELVGKNNELQRTDMEKTVMLQEIHHRVKNNLQIIISLLRMQSSQLENEEARLNYQVSIDRILSMALIHQRMYEQNDFSTITIEDYVRRLVVDMLQSHDRSHDIDLKVEGNELQLGLKTLVPLGLIVTELVSNTLKHGIPEKGSIEIKVEEKGDCLLFIFKDSGSWKEPKQKESFGLSLIETLVDQLEGEMSKEITASGTKFIIRFHDLDD